MLAGQTARILVQGLYFVVLARALGVVDFGVFAAVVALGAIASPFSSLGTNVLMIREASRAAETAPYQWTRAAIFTLVIGLFLSAILTALGPAVLLPAVLGLPLFLVLVADLIGLKIIETAAAVWQSIGDSRPLLVWPVITNVLRLVAVLPFLLSPGVSLAWWALAYFSATIPVAIGAATYTTFKLGRPCARIRLSAREAREGLALSVGLASQTVYNDIDKVMLARLGSAADAGLYAAAYRIVDMAYVPVRAIAATTYPLFFREGSSGILGALRLARKVAPLTLGYAAGAAILLAIGSPLVPLLLGPEFDGTETVLPWLSIVILTRSVGFLAADALTGADYLAFRTAVQVTVAILNVILNLVMIPALGLAGAILSTIICEFLLLLLLWSTIAVKWLQVRREPQ